ncbi:lytic transglycosylase domain-containing protein [Microbacterium terrisoli]|jgi:hypothetical protein|uniref:aggregation-promoting factor C-terminal-like domain-containing protein n=1 Tax=Microbacterium terrisoli TaxID=3242192 RepID=UPI0028050921|nr:lytic transglycosylase domain-containing protein [Microbacterium protaetiae]
MGQPEHRNLVRIRSLTLPQKSVFTAVSIAATLGVIAIPASAAAAPAPTAADAQTHISIPVLRPVDQNAAYFASVAQGTSELAEGKVSTASLDMRIVLLQKSPTMSVATAQVLTDQLREMTATVAAQVVAYDKAAAIKAAKIKAAKIKAAKEKAAKEKAAKAAAARKAAAAQQAYQRRSSNSAPASVSGGTGDNSPSAARAYARSLMASRYGWGGDQFQCLNSLWNRESGWRVHAANPSGAYGIPQALPGSKMGAGWQNSARVQVAWGLGYIKARYGTPCGAWGHSQSTGWY